jgi:2-polyprenyl-3-methyl-5-hydroxy-6-metoxy-1,4-benzoquinol methylase
MMQADKVQDYFTRSADLFDSLYSEERVNRMMAFLNRRFRRDIYERYVLTMEHARRYDIRSVLDVGCGSGRYELGLVDAGVQRVVGVDFSPTMIKLANAYTERLREHGSDIEFICTDFSDFNRTERFDLVLAMGVFDYIDRPLETLLRMKSFARHSVLISFPSISPWRTPIRKARYRVKRCPVYFYTPEQIERLGREAGFSWSETTKIRGAGMDYVVAYYL